MRCGGVVAWILAAACSTVGFGSAASARSADVVPLEIEAGGLSRLAASPNGQTVYAVDETTWSIMAIDPFASGRCRGVVGTPPEGRPRPVALVALPGDLVAVLCRDDDEWSLRTYRTRPREAVDAGQPLQDVTLGRGNGPETAAMAVSRTRDWFAVAGLPPPLPSVVRAAFAGSGVRRLPDEPSAGGPGVRPFAVAVGPADELVTLESSERQAPARLVFTGHGGRELLRLDIGLADVRGVAFARDGSALWVIAGEVGGAAPQPAGLWRLDAALREGRQAVRTTCVVRLDDPHAVAAVSDRSLVVVHGSRSRTISRIDIASEGGMDPQDDRREEEER